MTISANLNWFFDYLLQYYKIWFFSSYRSLSQTFHSLASFPFPNFLFVFVSIYHLFLSSYLYIFLFSFHFAFVFDLIWPFSPCPIIPISLIDSTYFGLFSNSSSIVSNDSFLSNLLVFVLLSFPMCPNIYSSQSVFCQSFIFPSFVLSSVSNYSFPI